MKNLRFSRRNLLQAAGLGTAANMLLPELRNPAYAAEAIPKMFLMFYSYHGTWKADWGSGAGGMTMGPLLQPLVPFKDDIVMIGDLTMRSANLYPGFANAGHVQGQVHSLTSTKPLSPVESEGSRPVAGGPSIDQAILEALKAKNGGKQLTEVDSLQLGIADAPPGSDQMLGRAGYRMVGGTIKPIGYANDPNLAWGTVFGDYAPGMGTTPVPTVPGKEDPARVQRRLMAQFARGQFDSVSGKVNNLYGKASVDRFKAHADYMSSLEKSLAQIDSGGGGTGTVTGGDIAISSQACIVPARTALPNKPTSGGWANVLSDNMPKLAHLALACGRTRFATIAIEATVTQDPGLHEKVHGRDMAGTRSYYVKIAEQVAKTIKLLKESPTPDGKNLLHHTVFLWAGELGDGGEHSFDKLQWMIGGQAGGDLQTGRFVDGKNNSNADLFLSLGKLMGADLPSFGDPRAFTGPMAPTKA
jgi:hypothetical protein